LTFAEHCVSSASSDVKQLERAARVVVHAVTPINQYLTQFLDWVPWRFTGGEVLDDRLEIVADTAALGQGSSSSMPSRKEWTSRKNNGR